MPRSCLKPSSLNSGPVTSQINSSECLQPKACGHVRFADIEVACRRDTSTELAGKKQNSGQAHSETKNCASVAVGKKFKKSSQAAPADEGLGRFFDPYAIGLAFKEINSNIKSAGKSQPMAKFIQTDSNDMKMPEFFDPRALEAAFKELNSNLQSALAWSNRTEPNAVGLPTAK